MLFSLKQIENKTLRQIQLLLVIEQGAKFLLQERDRLHEESMKKMFGKKFYNEMRRKFK